MYSCIISFNFDSIMQWKQFWNIVTKVDSRKSAITFGDLPDWWDQELSAAVLGCHQALHADIMQVNTGIK